MASIPCYSRYQFGGKRLIICRSRSPHGRIFVQAVDQKCTEGFLDLSSLTTTTKDTRLVPLLHSQSRQFETTEQWLFPDMRFSCHGLVTGWRFRGEYSKVIDIEDPGCRVHVTTWRRDLVNTFTTQYDQVSSTEDNVATPLWNDPFVTYQLLRAVRVQPGDVVGVETGFLCRSYTTNERNNIQSLNATGSGTVSYRRPGVTPTFFLTEHGTTTRARDLVLVLEPVFEQTSADGSALPDDIATNSDDRSSTIALAAGISGGFLGLAVIIIICIIAIWLLRHGQVQIRFSGTRSGGEEGDSGGNCRCDMPSAIHVEANEAYSRIVSNGQALEAPLSVDVDAGSKIGQENRDTRSKEEAKKESESEKEVGEAMTRNVAYEKEVEEMITRNVAYAKPLPVEPWSSESVEDRGEHTYEYIH